jgi:hypothetical protein
MRRVRAITRVLVLTVFGGAVGCAADASPGPGAIDGPGDGALFVSNANDEDRAEVEALFASVPRPLVSPPGADPFEIYVVGSRAALLRDDPASAFLASASKDSMRLPSALLPSSSLAEERDAFYARELCVAFDDAVGPPGVVTILVHESAHRFHAYRPEVRDAFVAVRFAELVERYRADPARAAASDAWAERRDDARADGEITDDEWAGLCDAYGAIGARYAAAGFPARWPTDTHGVVEDEYFAIAVELAFRDPDAYCRGYAAEERAILAAELPAIAPACDDAAP